jgi:LysR family transcriptional regulator for metE and metH
MIEPLHLRIVQALDRHGTLTEAAGILHLTQPALTHQIRQLEARLGVKLWQREGRRLRLTAAGKSLLETADHVLPVLDQAERNLRAMGAGRKGLLRIGVECFPCYQWLSGVMAVFLRRLPQVDIDIVNRFRFSGLQGLSHHHIDLLVTPDFQRVEGVHFERLADFPLLLLCAIDSPLASRACLEPADLEDQTLLSFPVGEERLDIFTGFLRPAGRRPAQIREMESLELMMQLVELGRGVCVLPAWLARQQQASHRLAALEIGPEGLQSSLYLALRDRDRNLAYVREFIELGRELARQSLAEPAVRTDVSASRG